MSDITTEKQMRPYVETWLKAQGYEVAHECHCFNNCDVVGYRFAKQVGRRIPELLDVVCVELKIRDFPGVLAQCRYHRYRAHRVYAAMPSHILQAAGSETLWRFSQHGIGLLDVSETGVRERIDSLNYAGDVAQATKALWEWHKGKRGRKDC